MQLTKLSVAAFILDDLDRQVLDSIIVPVDYAVSLETSLPRNRRGKIHFNGLAESAGAGRWRV